MELETEVDLKKVRYAQKLRNVREKFVGLKSEYEANSKQLREIEGVVKYYEDIRKYTNVRY